LKIIEKASLTISVRRGKQTGAILQLSRKAIARRLFLLFYPQPLVSLNNGIAHQLGLEYPQHFPRFFKAITKKTPLGYRNDTIGVN